MSKTELANNSSFEELGDIKGSLQMVSEDAIYCLKPGLQYDTDAQLRVKLQETALTKESFFDVDADVDA